MNDITQEIKNKVEKYGINLVFLGAGEGFYSSNYNISYVYPNYSQETVLKNINNMISERGELLLLRKALLEK